MGKSCSFGLQYIFCTISSLNKGDVHNCRLYVTIEIDTSVRAGCKDDKNRRRLV